MLKMTRSCNLTFISRHWRALYNTLTSALITFLTSTYAGPLHHYTLKPIALFCEHQNDYVKLRSLLSAFRASKERELAFVRKAVSIVQLSPRTNVAR